MNNKVNTLALRELLAAADYEGRHLPTIDVEVKAIRALDDWESYLPALLDRLEELEEAARWRDKDSNDA